VSILQKVWSQGVAEGSLAAKVSPTQPFGLRTDFRGKDTAKGLKKPVILRTSQGDTFIERADVPRNDAWIDQWKVILGLAYGERGPFPYWITSEPDILGPGTACTETYLVIDRFNSKKEAKLFAGYLRTRFVRFLISLRKNTQHLYNERFAFVPHLPMDREWTDEMLYKKYGITKDEIAFINSMIRPMGEKDE
jgi:site-specific DNA-methyltransferase (adenine-specific)